MTTVGIIQPNYIPWRGYFDFIRRVDVFIFLDDAQYTKRDWRNRNRIRTRDGKTIFLTVPVKHNRGQMILETRIDPSSNWAENHLATLKQSYAKTTHYNDYIDRLSQIYRLGHEFISDLDIDLTKEIAHWLGIETDFLRSSELESGGRKDEKLISLVRAVGGDAYLSGPAAKAYLQPDLWADAGIDLAFIEYPNYAPYRQVSDPYDPAVSILDLLFAVGPNAMQYIRGDLTGTVQPHE